MTDFARFSLGRLSAATIVKIRAHGCTATGRTLLERQQATVHLVDDLGVALSTLVNCAAPDVYYHSSWATRRAHAPSQPAVESTKGRLMIEQFVSKDSEFQDGERRIVFIGHQEIGIFKEDGRYYAYSNVCLHQGGPACEGLIIAKVEEKIMPDKTSCGLSFSSTERHFVCPWHGYEYDIRTGEFVGDRRQKLRSYQVVQKGENVYVIA